MRTPTIHLNGTDRVSLLEGYSEAIRRLRDAENAMAAAAPNARDYYPQGDLAIAEAYREHRRRMKAIDHVIIELEEIALSINMTA